MNYLYHPLIGSTCFGLSPIHHQEHHLIKYIMHRYVRAGEWMYIHATARLAWAITRITIAVQLLKAELYTYVPSSITLKSSVFMSLAQFLEASVIISLNRIH